MFLKDATTDANVRLRIPLRLSLSIHYCITTAFARGPLSLLSSVLDFVVTQVGKFMVT
jgi:hypothetical protein